MGKINVSDSIRTIRDSFYFNSQFSDDDFTVEIDSDREVFVLRTLVGDTTIPYAEATTQTKLVQAMEEQLKLFKLLGAKDISVGNDYYDVVNRIYSKDLESNG